MDLEDSNAAQAKEGQEEQQSVSKDRKPYKEHKLEVPPTDKPPQETKSPQSTQLKKNVMLIEALKQPGDFTSSKKLIETIRKSKEKGMSYLEMYKELEKQTKKK